MFFLFILFWMLPWDTVATKPSCAYFRFDNSMVRSNSVDVIESKTVRLIFYLLNETCVNMENTITIRRLDNVSNSYTPQCDIVLKNDACRNTTYEHMYCGCRNTFGEYTFSKVVSKSDITWWKWTTKDGLADDVYIFFNETRNEGHSASFPTADDQISPSSPSSLSNISSSLGTKDVSPHGDKAYEEMKLTAIAVGACLIIIIICLVSVIYFRKRGQNTVKTSVSYDCLDHDTMIINQSYRRPTDREVMNTDFRCSDFIDIYFCNNDY